MSTTARRRLLHDLKKLQNDSPAGINAAPSSTDNVMEWQAVIFGYVSNNACTGRRRRRMWDHMYRIHAFAFALSVRMTRYGKEAHSN